MKYFDLICFTLITAAIFYSCTDDTGEVTVNYLEATAIYGDMDEIRSIPINEGPRAIENAGKIFVAEDYVLIGEEGKGIHVVNNQDRNNPISSAFIAIPGNKEFFVSGNALYAESYYDLMKIDITDPSQAVLISRSKNAIQDEFKNDKGETLIGFSYEEKTITLDENDDFMNEIVDDQLVYYDFARNVIPKSSVPSSFAGNSAEAIGSVNRITTWNDYVYIVSNNNMIIVEDGENGLASNAIRIENIKEEMETVFPYQDNLFVGSKTSMSIFNISNGNEPIELYEFEHATSCDPVLPYKDVAYITLRTADFSDCPGNINALLAIDINDLLQPVQVMEKQMASPYGMSVINDHLFVGNGENGLSIFDVSEPQSPVLVNSPTDIVAFDIIADPSNTEYILIAGNNGMQQYKVNEDKTLEWTSAIDY
ncbi:MAG: hypothetical protein AAGA77_00325 [Bacteroidota bacterium]